MSETAQDHAPQAPWRIGVDVGGTFTDMVLCDAAGRLFVFKVPSNPTDPSAGVMAVLTRAAQECRLDLEVLLGECAGIVHGSTIATNTMLEGKGAKIGFIVTEGFRDFLEIRRGIRADAWDHRAAYPPVLAPRYLRLPVRGRLLADGTEHAPLVIDDIASAVQIFAAEGVESVAICLMNAYANGAHERAVGAALAQCWDGQWVSLSSEIAPVAGEYERGSTVAVNAALAPKVVGYLQKLAAELQASGLAAPLLIMQSNGGAISVDRVALRPVNLCLSGPAAGVGALNLYARTSGSDDLICMEIGGTSCDVTLMGAGTVAVSDDLMIADYQLATPSVEIHTVGAGGGTIAGVDAAGLVYVGPEGAGARPGPACYGFGGERPTVTDAQLVLGRLRPGAYAGGAVTLDAELARQAIETHVAQPLGVDVERAAIGIIQVLEQNLLHAVERMSIERGHNTRNFTLVAAGGAGPMHGSPVARALGCRRAYVPRQAGAFCALGMLYSDIRQDFMRVWLAALLECDTDALQAAYGELETDAQRTLAEEGLSGTAARIEREMDLRYRGQQWSVRVPVAGNEAVDIAAVKAAFEAEHDRLFGHIQPMSVIEITQLRVVARGVLAPPAPMNPEAATAAVRPFETRPVYLDEREGWADTRVYRGADLAPGHEIPGPALIEEQTTTVFVGADDILRVDTSGNFAIELAAEPSTEQGGGDA